jgi:hypothetical protein
MGSDDLAAVSLSEEAVNLTYEIKAQDVVFSGTIDVCLDLECTSIYQTLAFAQATSTTATGTYTAGMEVPINHNNGKLFLDGKLNVNDQEIKLGMKEWNTQYSFEFFETIL